MRRSNVVLSVGSATAMVAITMVGATSATAAPQPRISPSQCGFNAPNNGYVVTDPSTNTKCVTNANGTYMWVQGANIQRCKNSAFVASFRIIPRGDVRQYVTYNFVRGNVVISKRVLLRPGQKASTAFQFKRNGRWTVVARYNGKRVTTTVNVRPGGTC